MVLKNSINDFFKKNISFQILLFGLCSYIVFLPFMQNPYNPFLSEINGLKVNNIQISDLILLIVSPWGFYQLLLNWKKIFLNKYLLFITIGYLLYLSSLFLGINNYENPNHYFEFFAACSLISLFYFIILLSLDDLAKFFLVFSGILSFAIVIFLCSFALLTVVFFEIRWDYIIQENPVFPYLGEIYRLTGPFKPTSKLLSTYLTLMIPITLIIAIKSETKLLKYFLILCTILGTLIYPFTLSRGICGFTFAISILFLGLVLKYKINKFYFAFSLVISICAMVVVWFASTFHILNFKFENKHDYNLNHERTVYYYFDPVKGKSNLNFEIDYAYDHYYWLKKASWEIFKRNLGGVGNNSFSKKVKKLENLKFVPKKISRHPTPQSEFHQAAAFYGVFGILSIFIIFVSWVFPILFNKKNIFAIACAGSIFAVTFIDSWFIEITRFRFLWAFVAIFIGFSIFNKKRFEIKC